MTETNNTYSYLNKLPLKEHLTVEGSLGILAYGDLAVMAWKELVAESKSNSKLKRK